MILQLNHMLNYTPDFLRKLHDLSNIAHDILVSFDVTNLYTSINHRCGIEKIRNVLIQTDYTNECISLLLGLFQKQYRFRFTIQCSPKSSNHQSTKLPSVTHGLFFIKQVSTATISCTYFKTYKQRINQLLSSVPQRKLKKKKRKTTMYYLWFVLICNIRIAIISYGCSCSLDRLCSTR